MSERITEAEPQRWTADELAALERQAKQSQLPGADPIVEVFAGNCVHLIDEVRRLRGLIVEAHGNVEHVKMTPIEAEARAIREEQGR